MSDHPNAQDLLHCRPPMTEELSSTVAEEYWSATAPVQQDHFGEAGRIPIRLARLAWDAYAAAGHSSSLDLINDRGGFSWGELIMLLRGPGHYRAPNHHAHCFKDCAKGMEL